MRNTLCFVALVCWSAISHAGGISFPYFDTSYTVDLTGIPSPVTNILVQETPGAYYAQRMNFLGPSSGIAPGSQITTLTNPFLNTNPYPNTISLGIGVVTDLPGDPPGQQHLVFFMNAAATALATGVNWGALFPIALEDQVIADVELGTSGGGGWGNSFTTLAPGLASAAAFMNSMASPGGLLGPSGIYTSPYFNLPPPGSPATNFDVVAFSDGQVIGTGSVVQTYFSPTPEPPTFALSGAVLAVALWFRRRRSKSS